MCVVLNRRYLFDGTFNDTINVNVLLMGSRNLGYLNIAVLTLLQDNIFCPVQCIDKKYLPFLLIDVLNIF